MGQRYLKMATLTSFPEEECLNVYWKIKNFSFCFEKLDSPEYSLSGNRYWLRLNPGYGDLECRLYGFKSNEPIHLTREISFLTYDDSAEESISGGIGVCLRVPKGTIFGKRRKAFLPEDTLTVRIRFLTDSERGKVFICSQIGVKRKYFLWRVNHFSSCINTVKSIEKSEQYGDVKLTLKSVDGFHTDEQFYIEISRTGGGRCCYFLKVSVLDVEGKTVKEESDKFVFEKNADKGSRMFPAFFKKSEFLGCKNLLLPEDSLSLKCNFAMSLGALADQSDVISCDEDITPFLKESEDLPILSYLKGKSDSGSVTELQIDLKRMLENGALQDVRLKIGSEVIPAHKSILGARSTVFRAMFSTDMKEAVSSTVYIEDFDVETVRRLVLYMYTDSIDGYQWESMKDLYHAADKYEVLGLKKKCASFLKTNLSVSNVCEALIIADLHQDQDLKTAAIDFIFDCDSAVFASETWKELEKVNPPLAIEVMRKICCNNRLRQN